jgi:tellurite resistance protein TehA-like permease
MAPRPPPSDIAMPPSPASSARHWRDSCRDGIATLFPGYFALVMATGIIANGMFFEGQRAISDALLAVNLVAYGALVAMTLLRAVLFPRALWQDLTEPRLVFAFFTLVAATDVVGVGLSLRGFTGAAVAMWLAALTVWLALIYLSFAVLIFFNTAARADIIFGGWLIAIVATEAVAIHGVVVAPAFGAAAPYVMLFGHMLWGVGLVLYAIFIVLFAHRIFFSDVRPQDITPILWVVMGAAAISTNAGALFIVTDPALPFLVALRPFVDCVTLILWAWATWWIPLLVVFGIWTHGVHRLPLTYTPLFWGLVFPLGMYALASLRLSNAAGLSALATLSGAAEWIALAAWLITSAGFVVTLWRRLHQPAMG